MDKYFLVNFSIIIERNDFRVKNRPKNYLFVGLKIYNLVFRAFLKFQKIWSESCRKKIFFGRTKIFFGRKKVGRKKFGQKNWSKKIW